MAEPHFAVKEPLDPMRRPVHFAKASSEASPPAVPNLVDDKGSGVEPGPFSRQFDGGTTFITAQAERGGKIRRFAVRAPDDLNEEDAISQAIPLLKEWVTENETHWLRYAG